MNALNSLMSPAAIGQTVQQGFQQGRQMRSQMETQNALSTLVTDPTNQDAMQNLARFNPQAALQYQGVQQQRQARQDQAEQEARENRLKQVPVMIQLLEGSTSPETYARNLAVAQQNGFDVSSAPQQYDPQWISSQVSVLRLLSNPEGQKALSTFGKQAADEGFAPGTPEFGKRVTELVNASNITTHSVQPGGTIIENDKIGGEQRVIVQGGNMPQQTYNQAPARNTGPDTAGEVITFDQLQGMARGLSPDALTRQIQRLTQGGVKFSVASPDQAGMLPPGTRYTTPDGAEYIR